MHDHKDMLDSTSQRSKKSGSVYVKSLSRLLSFRSNKSSSSSSLPTNKDNDEEAKKKKRRLCITLGLIALLVTGISIGLGVYFGIINNSKPTGNPKFTEPPPPLPQADFVQRPQDYAGKQVAFVPGREIGRYVLAKGDGGSSGVSAIHVGLMKDTGKAVFIER
ncbi:hypothetical protein HDV05_003645, partial [Chytridiales sp. JEL 0842]